MKPENAETLSQLIAGLELVPAGPLAEALHEVGNTAAAEELGRALVRREVLTGFQLERLLKGERTGYRYGRAKLLYQIGAGSFARVYRAVDIENGNSLAVKVLRNRYSTDPDKCRAFRHEGEMGQMLRHPNIVAIYDVGEEAGASYITMEFVEGQTLRELVKRRGSVDLPKAFDLIHQMSAGLEYAHRRGVTHRDLKASNVIVSSTGHVKLVDFGLAGVDESDGTLEKVSQPRTVDYAALEKLTGMKDDAVRSDIYFLGAIAYLTITGVSPLKETRDRNERSDPRRYTSVVPIKDQKPDLARDVIDFINRSMALDAMERLQTATDVKRRAEAILLRVSGGESSDSVVLSSIIAYKGSLMLVESSERCQDKLRDFFTRLGYKVLLTESPQRALSRFSNVPRPADLLVLSTHKLGEEAVKAFNMLSTNPQLVEVPAILLADSTQGSFSGTARVDDRRRFVLMPIHAESMTKLFAELMTLARPNGSGSQLGGGSQVLGGSQVIGDSQVS